MNREFGEYGPRVFANVGLTQTFKVGEAWAMDVGVDRSDTVTGADAERFNPNVPLVIGAIGDDFLATFVGAQYRADLWTITSRVERRDSDLAERRSFTSGFYREPIEGRALSVTTRWLDNDATRRRRPHRRRASLVRLSAARQPLHRARAARSLAGRARRARSASFETTRFVNNVNLHWQVDRRFEFGTQIGARYAKSTIDGARYSGWSTLLGFDVRRDLTPVLDLGGHARGSTPRPAARRERSAGFDVGISAARNVWISIGYNFEGFRDDHFDASRYTAQGPYVRFRIKVDQDSFKDLDLSRLRVNNGADERSAAATPEPQQPTGGATLP